MIDSKYYELFKQIARSTEVTSEQVMDYNHKNNDEGGEKTAQTMRDDFRQLYDRLSNPDYQITRNDYLKLFVGCYIVLNMLENNQKNIQTSIHGYKQDIIPKLQRITDETKTDEEADKLASEIFQINV